MFAKELFIAGDDEDFIKAGAYFVQLQNDCNRTPEEMGYIYCVLAKYSRLCDDCYALMKVALKSVASTASAEICYELGEYYYNKNDYEEALIWFYILFYQPIWDMIAYMKQKNI